MVEDQEEDADEVEYILRKSVMIFTLYQVETKEAYIKAIEDLNPDIILSDHSFPQFDSETTKF